MKYLILFLFCLPAHAAPWVMAGQTSIPANSAINNPAGNDIGAIGQVTSLPYTVPVGCTLHIDGYGIEAYDWEKTSVIFLWTGDPNGDATYRRTHSTISVAAKAHTTWVTGLRYYFPAGTVINMRLQNATSYNNAVFAWGISGDLQC